jgi:hypothetical protein
MGKSMRKSKRFRPTLNDKLEDRTVPSHALGFPPSQVLALHSGFGGRGGGSLGGGFGFQGGGDLGAHTQPGGVTASSSTLYQDARQVQQAFQSFNGSFLAAVAALRTTATTSAAPTMAGLASYNSAIASAVSALNSSISTTLSSNLPNTGSSLISTITGSTGYTSTLQTELESAGSGLANSTNQAVLELKQEANPYIRNALSQITTAILSDQPAGSITASTVQTYNQAVRTAVQAFNLSISNAVQTAISGGTQLRSATVSPAVSTLTTALTNALNGLGTPFTSSTYNPTSTVTTQLTNLKNQLLAIAAPTAGSKSSVRLFSRTVFSDVAQNLSTINTTVATAIQDYNTSLL